MSAQTIHHFPNRKYLPYMLLIQEGLDHYFLKSNNRLLHSQYENWLQEKFLHQMDDYAE